MRGEGGDGEEETLSGAGRWRQSLNGVVQRAQGCVCVPGGCLGGGCLWVNSSASGSH